MPTVSPVTVIGDDVRLAVMVVPVVGMHVAVKLVIGLPPVAPALKEMTTWPAVWVIDVIVGADGATGTVPATNELDATDAGLVPITLVATTVQV
jgi:hypothetical protein